MLLLTLFRVYLAPKSQPATQEGTKGRSREVSRKGKGPQSSKGSTPTPIAAKKDHTHATTLPYIPSVRKQTKLLSVTVEHLQSANACLVCLYVSNNSIP